MPNTYDIKQVLDSGQLGTVAAHFADMWKFLQNKNVSGLPIREVELFRDQVKRIISQVNVESIGKPADIRDGNLQILEGLCLLVAEKIPSDLQNHGIKTSMVWIDLRQATNKTFDIRKVEAKRGDYEISRMTSHEVARALGLAGEPIPAPAHLTLVVDNPAPVRPTQKNIARQKGQKPSNQLELF